MQRSIPVLTCALLATTASAYPPAVGLLGPARDCLVCHADNGPWKDDARLVIDVMDKATGTSLKQADGSFLVRARRGEAVTLLTVIGVRKGGDPSAVRHAWLYVDPDRIPDTTALSKFVPGWTTNLPMACRLAGDAVPGHPDGRMTSLPMTVRPGEDARDGVLELQVMITKGDAVKGKGKEGMIGNYFRRTVRLEVVQDSQTRVPSAAGGIIPGPDRTPVNKPLR